MLELLGLITRNLEITGGSQGFLMPLPDWDLRFQNWPFFYALYALVLLSVAMTVAIRRSKLGLGLMAIRDDEDKAAGIGVVTPIYKSLAFMASAVLVGIAGAVYGYYISVLSVSTMFDIVLSMQIVLAALLGGRGTVWGPVLGAFIVVPLTEVTNTTLGGRGRRCDPAPDVRRAAHRGRAADAARHPAHHRRPPGTDGAALRTSRTGEPPRRTPPIPAAPTSRRVAATTDADDALPACSRVDVTMRFGGSPRWTTWTVEIAQGSITALIGPNGSGKTTLFNVIDGTYAPDHGEVLLDGRPRGPADRTAPGPRRHRADLPAAAALPEPHGPGERRRGDRRLQPAPARAQRRLRGEAARATELLEFVGMGEYLEARATDLSYGQRKLVELAQVLMLDPAVILLDEPAAGINPTLLRRLTRPRSIALNQAGRTFVIVEHDMHFVLSLADSAVVLARGQVIASGDPATVSADPRVLDAYLGDDFVLEASDPAVEAVS